ncbi:hypothetical protein E2562_011422 [Oryza meyeriana var. granulata]|uniref:Uncharacterized protein n=1 Tax=Oryza meyeriana var. granulata TaxID=110450 RepID=A0A6G1D2Q9_9ORYZ|nr:hypothetical protein E2562_011422 [Oryza meyeriana var. granulata]
MANTAGGEHGVRIPSQAAGGKVAAPEKQLNRFVLQPAAACDNGAPSPELCTTSAGASTTIEDDSSINSGAKS